MASNTNTAKPSGSSEQKSSELEDSTLCSVYMRVLSQTSVRDEFLKVSKRHSELLESFRLWCLENHHQLIQKVLPFPS